MPVDPPPRKLRVLLVPDSLPWVTGTMARQIAAHNPWVEATICSGNALARAAQSSRILLAADVVHYLTEYEPGRCGHLVPDDIARVNSVHHVEDWVLARSLITTGDAVHVVSRSWQRQLTEAGASPDRAVLVQNGVDTVAFRPPAPGERDAVRRSVGVPADGFAVGMFAKKSSNSSDRKGIDVFAAAAARAAAAGVPVTAVVVGPGWGPMCGELRAAGVRTAMQSYVEGQDRVAELYRALDVYWVTSRIEGGPVPLLEAMASGVGCIATPVGIVPEVVRDGENGFAVGFGDVDGFVDRTRRVWADSDLRRRLGASARETIVRDWDWAATTRSVGDLYAAALGHWAVRTGRTMPVDIAAAQAYYTEKPDRNRFGSVLPAISATARAAVRAEEVLVWLRELEYSGNHRAAARVAAQALLADPSNRRLILGITSMLARQARVRVVQRGRAILAGRT